MVGAAEAGDRAATSTLVRLARSPSSTRIWPTSAIVEVASGLGQRRLPARGRPRGAACLAERLGGASWPSTSSGGSRSCAAGCRCRCPSPVRRRRARAAATRGPGRSCPWFHGEEAALADPERLGRRRPRELAALPRRPPPAGARRRAAEPVPGRSRCRTERRPPARGPGRRWGTTVDREPGSRRGRAALGRRRPEWPGAARCGSTATSTRATCVVDDGRARPPCIDFGDMTAGDPAVDLVAWPGSGCPTSARVASGLRAHRRPWTTTPGAARKGWALRPGRSAHLGGDERVIPLGRATALARGRWPTPT